MLRHGRSCRIFKFHLDLRLAIFNIAISSMQQRAPAARGRQNHLSSAAYADIIRAARRLYLFAFSACADRLFRHGHYRAFTHDALFLIGFDAIRLYLRRARPRRSRHFIIFDAEHRHNNGKRPGRQARNGGGVEFNNAQPRNAVQHNNLRRGIPDGLRRNERHSARKISADADRR